MQSKTTMSPRSVRILIVLAVVLLLSIVPVSAMIQSQNAERSLVSDLAAASGLKESEVSYLINLTKDQEQVQESIFVYKEILTMAKESDFSGKDLDKLIREYSPEELLTVFEYLAENDRKLAEANNILSDHPTGTDLQEVLSDAEQKKEYKVYVPATEDQIRIWLTQGLLPDDILAADEKARAADQTIETVLSQKTTDKDSPAKTQSSVQSTEEKPDIKIKNGDEITDYSAADYKSSEAQITNGFNQHEIENAERLSKESGVSAEKILEEKKAGADWESLIRKYHKAEKEAGQ